MEAAFSPDGWKDFAVVVGGASAALAGVGLTTEAIGGLLWLVPFVIAAIVGGTAQVWVLLVEVRR